MYNNLLYNVQWCKWNYDKTYQYRNLWDGVWWCVCPHRSSYLVIFHMWSAQCSNPSSGFNSSPGTNTSTCSGTNCLVHPALQTKKNQEWGYNGHNWHQSLLNQNFVDLFAFVIARMKKLPIVGAKYDGIFIGVAGKRACAIIKCVAISSRTRSLKNARVVGWPTCIWICILPTATILVHSKCTTSTVARDYPTYSSTIPTHHLKLFWAPCICFLLSKHIEIQTWSWKIYKDLTWESRFNTHLC